jgi:hypothetical protein
MRRLWRQLCLSPPCRYAWDNSPIPFSSVKFFVVFVLTLHTANAVGFLSGERPQSISVSGNPQAKGCVITPSHMDLRHPAHVPTWAAYLLPVR